MSFPKTCLFAGAIGPKLKDKAMNRLGISVIALCAALPAAAQDGAQDIALDEIVVTGNLEPVAAKRTGANVAVVSGEEIAQRAERQVTATLARQPGLYVRASGSVGGNSGLWIRGLNPHYSLVLVDGINVGDPAGTQVTFNFGGMTTLGLGRIEVLKGSQSALYGSSAIAGVVSLNSARPEQEGLTQEAEIEVGGHKTRAASYTAKYKNGGTEAVFSLGRVISDGFNAQTADTTGEADGYASTRASVMLRHEFDSGLTLGMNAFREESLAEYDSGGPTGQSDRTQTGLRAFAEFTTGAVDHTLSFSRYDTTRLELPGYKAPPAPDRFAGDRFVADYKAAFDLADGLTAVLGADHTVESYDALNRQAITNGLYAEISYSATEALDATLSLRHDNHSQFGGKTTGRLSLAYRPREDLTFRLQAGTGYRAPSLNELYGPFGSNPNFVPETSRSVDASVEYAPSEQTVLRFTAYRTTTDNKLEYCDLDPVWGWCPLAGKGIAAIAALPAGFSGYVQIPGTTTQGAEISGDFKLSETYDLHLGYGYVDARDAAGAQIRYVPRHTLSADLTAQWSDKLSGTISVQHGADLPGLKDFTVVGLRATYKFRENLEGYVRIENLFDEKYQINSGYNTSGRTAYVGLRTTF